MQNRNRVVNIEYGNAGCQVSIQSTKLDSFFGQESTHLKRK